MEKNYIKLEKIDTSTAAKNFADLLKENKTYFLNGNWGSGKSTFLKDINDTKQVKLVTIDFWRLNDSRSTLETVFANLHPFVYWGLRLIVILCIALSILMTNVVDLGLSAYVPNWVVLLAGVIALIVALHQFLKIKSDGIYSRLLTFNFPSCKKKVIVVDDFDRMTNVQQESSYKLFSLLNGKLPIIFVGDIELLHKSDTNYLSKIIDRRVELPYDLQPIKIWKDYFEQLEKRFKIQLSYDFKDVIQKENRNLRDRERFNDYVNLELIDRNKEEYVQIEQQLTVIYIYIFYPQLYDTLLKEEELPKLNPKSSINKTVLNTILKKQPRTYPPPYPLNKEVYLISEMPSNRSERELHLLIENDQSLYKEIGEELSSDFTEYISIKFTDIDFIYRKKLFDVSFTLSEEGKNNWLIDFIIMNMAKINIKYPNYELDQLFNQLKVDTKSKFIRQVKEFWWTNTELTDFSEILYYSFKHKVMDKEHIRDLVTDISPFDEMFSSFRRKEQVILFYIYINRMDEDFSRWDKELLDIINNLNNQEFIDFLLGFAYIRNIDGNEGDFNINGKSYVKEKVTEDDGFDLVSQEFDSRINKIKDF